MATVEVDDDYTLTAGAAVEVDVDYLLIASGLASVTVLADYAITDPSATGSGIEVDVDYRLNGRPKLMVRSGNSLVAARLGMRQGSTITWLSPPLP